jgi:hypothetical protein
MSRVNTKDLHRRVRFARLDDSLHGERISGTYYVVKADLTKAEARKHAKKIREAGFLARVVAHAGPKAKRGYKVCQGHRRRRAPRKNLDI